VKLEVATLSEGWKTVAAGVCRVEGLQHSDVIEGLPQGVRAKSIF
jgi:hypothetical protein